MGASVFESVTGSSFDFNTEISGPDSDRTVAGFVSGVSASFFLSSYTGAKNYWTDIWTNELLSEFLG